MRDLFVRLKYLTYSLSFGPDQATTRFTLKHINGSGLGGSYWDTWITSWLTGSQKLSQGWTTLRRWSSLLWTPSRFRTYRASHRDPSGIRQTYAGIRTLRAAREAAWDQYQAFLELRDPSTVGVAYLSPPVGSRAYRKLAPSILNRETVDLIRRYAPREWDEWDDEPLS